MQEVTDCCLPGLPLIFRKSGRCRNYRSLKLISCYWWFTKNTWRLLQNHTSARPRQKSRNTLQLLLCPPVLGEPSTGNLTWHLLAGSRELSSSTPSPVSGRRDRGVTCQQAFWPRFLLASLCVEQSSLHCTHAVSLSEPRVLCCMNSSMILLRTQDFRWPYIWFSH